MKNGMAMDFSWLSSAEQYLKLYEKTVTEKAAGSGQLTAGSPATTLRTGRKKTDDRRKKKEDGRQTTKARRQKIDDRRKGDKVK